jgi:hypothetical protein
MITNAKNVETCLKFCFISQSWINKLSATTVVAKKQRGFSVFLILKGKPWHVLAREKLNFLQSIQNKARGWVEEWAEA